MLKNAHKNQLLVVYQNKAINIVLASGRQDWTNIHVLYRFIQEDWHNKKISKLHDRFYLKLKLTKDSEQNQCKNKSFSGAVCFFVTGFRWEILKLISILEYHCIFLDLSVFQPKVSYFATDVKQHHRPTVSNRYSQEG